MNFFSGFWDNLVGLFVPPASFWDDVRVAVENKFTFLAGFNTALEAWQNTQGQPLKSEFTFLGYTWVIDLSFYEPYRLTVRSLSSALFYALAGLACLEMISSVFRVDFGKKNHKK